MCFLRFFFNLSIVEHIERKPKSSCTLAVVNLRNIPTGPTYLHEYLKYTIFGSEKIKVVFLSQKFLPTQKSSHRQNVFLWIPEKTLTFHVNFSTKSHKKPNRAKKPHTSFGKLSRT